MATPAATRHFTVEEYVELEERSNIKHDYVAGEVHAMGGGSRAHGVRTMNLGRVLGNALQGRPCVVQSGDVRIRIEAANLNVYPDLSVVCGPATLHATDSLAVTNPCLIAEVLSPSTESYDRRTKLDAYKRIAGLAEVVLVAHDEHRIEAVQRAADGTWRTVTAGPGESLVLVLGPTIRVDEIYFDPTEPR